jgi:hypothetical protein
MPWNRAVAVAKMVGKDIARSAALRLSEAAEKQLMERVDHHGQPGEAFVTSSVRWLGRILPWFAPASDARASCSLSRSARFFSDNGLAGASVSSSPRLSCPGAALSRSCAVDLTLQY